MDLSLDESQTILLRTFSDLLERECPTTLVRDCEGVHGGEGEGEGFSAALWDRYVELGAPGMGLPEAMGGLGMGLLDLGLVAAASGRALAPVPFIEVAVAGRLLARFGAEAELLESIAERGTPVSLAPSYRNPVAGTHTDARRLVPFGHLALHALGEVGNELILVSRADARPSSRLRDVGSGAHALWDLSPDAATPARRMLATGDAARGAMQRAMAEWKLLCAFWLTGLAQRALEIGTDYAKERVQFGVAIGGFQAIAHPLADCATRIDGAELLAWEAAWADESEPDRFEKLASMAFVWAAQTALRTAGISLHTHGGYGFSTEYDIQLYYRRACSAALILGGTRGELPHIAKLSIARAADPKNASPGMGAGQEERS